MTPEQTKSTALVMLAWAEKPDTTVVERRLKSAAGGDGSWHVFDPRQMFWDLMNFNVRPSSPRRERLWVLFHRNGDNIFSYVKQESDTRNWRLFQEIEP